MTAQKSFPPRSLFQTTNPITITPGVFRGQDFACLPSLQMFQTLPRSLPRVDGCSESALSRAVLPPSQGRRFRLISIWNKEQRGQQGAQGPSVQQTAAALSASAVPAKRAELLKPSLGHFSIGIRKRCPGTVFSTQSARLAAPDSNGIKKSQTLSTSCGNSLSWMERKFGFNPSVSTCPSWAFASQPGKQG